METRKFNKFFESINNKRIVCANICWTLCNGFKKHVVEDDGLFTNCLVVVGLPARTCVVFST